MSATLYRKYRPKNFSEIIGQKHIVQTLSNAIKNNRIGQAYLFTGPRGTGKTSIARILAKTVNCTDLKNAVTCEKCRNCQMIAENKSLDIIEIDAASNTGVDNIRELRETISLPPTALKYKVYIIDEVHMLSTGAFNALLKTLEEPPAHVIFILATTEIHKVPATILSRCQRFDFTRLPIENIIEKLTLIAKAEKINIDADSLEMIAIAAEGGMRDAESLFGQIIALEDKNITAKEVEEILGTTDRKFSSEVAGMILVKDATGAIAKINELLNNGYDLQIFTKSLINYTRQLMLLKINPELKNNFSYEATQDQIKTMTAQIEKAELPAIILTLNLLLEAQNKIAASMLPQLPLEIAIIRATHTFPANSTNYTTQETKGNINLHVSTQNIQTPPMSAPMQTEEVATVPEMPIVEQILPEGDTDLHTVKSNWKRLLTEIKSHNHSLAALLASNWQAISVAGNEITLATPYDFYKEKLNDHANKLTVESVLGKILGLQIRLKIVTYKEAGIVETPKMPEVEASDDTPGEQNSLLSSAMEIMGAKVVTEE
ncbi:MAG: polymerase III, subunit gamma and tau protein [Candidatus Moranbacteria bacterium GW2011_GWA2_39_41]|nr:MAG: polymerase III, subunit gamma and tau protein [Candidatus Moranbacteria bacterium GW2011_GWA2_39_41]